MNRKVVEDFYKLTALRQQLCEQKKLTLKRIRAEKKRQDSFIKAREVFKSAAEQSVVNVKAKIESLVTIIVQGIYEDDSEYILQFKPVKNSIKYIPSLKVDGHLYEDIEDDDGGGVMDAISFAQRIAFWAIKKSKTRPIFFLDEPFKNLGKLKEKAIKMVMMLSRKLNLQFLIITHEDELMEGDRIYHLTKKRGVTYATKRRKGKN